MQAVFDAQEALGARPIERLTPVNARIEPSAADATIDVMQQRGMSTAPEGRVVVTG